MHEHIVGIVPPMTTPFRADDTIGDRGEAERGRHEAPRRSPAGGGRPRAHHDRGGPIRAALGVAGLLP